MKLSKLLSEPFKLKGGGFLNLKGFSKRIIDKEIGGSNNSNNSNNNVNKFDKLFHVKVPKLSSVYNGYYDGIGDVPENNLSNFGDNGIDIPIYDPNDNNFFVVLLATVDIINEVAGDFVIFNNNFEPAIEFIVAIETDPETGYSYIVIGEFNNIFDSDEDYSSIYPYIYNSISEMNVDVLKRIIGEPQE